MIDNRRRNDLEELRVMEEGLLALDNAENNALKSACIRFSTSQQIDHYRSNRYKISSQEGYLIAHVKAIKPDPIRRRPVEITPNGSTVPFERRGSSSPYSTEGSDDWEVSSVDPSPTRRPMRPQYQRPGAPTLLP